MVSMRQAPAPALVSTPAPPSSLLSLRRSRLPTESRPRAVQSHDAAPPHVDGARKVDAGLAEPVARDDGGQVPAEAASQVPQKNPAARSLKELHRDRSPRPRPGESAAEAADRVRQAETELLQRAPDTMAALGDTPPIIDVRRGDALNSAEGAHTIKNHGADIPLMRQPGTKTIEGRLHGDPPWTESTNLSFKWASDAVMNEAINDYLRANWEAIKMDLALEGRHAKAFDSGKLAGEGFVNESYGTSNPVKPRYARTSLVRLILVLRPGAPPSFFVYTAFPNYLGTAAY